MATKRSYQTRVVTGEVRLSYVHLLEPWAFDTEEPKYSVTMLIRKDDADTVAKVRAAADEAVERGIAEKWGGGKPANLGSTLKDGDDMDDPSCAGCWVLRASSRNRPGVVDRQVQPVIDPDQVYSGCYGRVSFSWFPYSVSGNNGISAGLINVQILRDGEPLGTRTRPEDDFKPVNDDPHGVDNLLG